MGEGLFASKNHGRKEKVIEFTKFCIALEQVQNYQKLHNRDTLNNTLFQYFFGIYLMINLTSIIYYFVISSSKQWQVEIYNAHKTPKGLYMTSE